LAFRYSGDGKQWQNIDYFEILEHSISNPHQEMLVKLDIPFISGSLLQTIIDLDFGKQYITQAEIHPSSYTKPVFEMTNMGKNLLLNFSNIQNADRLKLRVSENVTYQGTSKGRFEYVLPASKLASDSLVLQLENAHQIILDTTLIVHMLAPNQQNEIIDQTYQSSFISESKSLYDTLCITKRSFSDTSLQSILPVLSRTFEWLPSDQKLKNNVIITLPYQSHLFKSKQLGIYTSNGNGNLSYLHSTADTVSQRIFAKSEKLGRFFVGADTVLPELEIYYPQKDAKYKPMKNIRFKAWDTLSGISIDRSIKVSLDDRFVLPEWDPEEELIIAQPHFPVKSGKHILEISVTDAAGNTRVVKIPFNIL
jgi:hypothetical protein